jgi:hypothetical protein
MRASPVIIFSVITLFLLLYGAPQLFAQGSGALVIEVQNDRLTLRAQDAPLAAVLERLSQVSGISIYTQTPPEEHLSLTLIETNLEDGLQRLLQHRNTLFLYGPGGKRLSAVQVLGLRNDTVTASEFFPVSAGIVEAEPEPEHVKTALQVQELDQQLAALAATQTPGVSAFMTSFLHDPETAMRLTALQWLAGRQDTVIDALTTALRDSDDVVQRAAFEILLTRGGTDQDIETVRMAVPQEDDTALRARINALLAPREPSGAVPPAESE